MPGPEPAGGRAEGDLPLDRSLFDPASGLFGPAFFLATVQLRVEVCRRELRPLSLVVAEVLTGLPDGPVQPASPPVVARVVRATLRLADVAGRLADGTYGLLLEGTTEDGAIWTVSRLRLALGTRPDGRVLRAGIACYPGHALDASELLAGALDGLGAARQWNQDRVEVAPAPRG